MDVSLRDLVLSYSETEWFIKHKKNIMFELNHCELHHVDNYLLNLYRNGVKSLPNKNNSNIAYLIGITEEEPSGKITTVGGGFPDIDSDIERDRRQEVFDFLKDKYGDGFAHLGTITYTGGKNAWKSSARIHGMGFDKANKISSMMPDTGCPPLDELLEQNKDIRKLYDSDPEVKEVYDDAIDLSNCIGALGVHACFRAGSNVYWRKTLNDPPRYINIEDIEVGDYVYTHKFRWRQVTKTHINDVRGSDIISIPLSDCRNESLHERFTHLSCTRNHPISRVIVVDDWSNRDDIDPNVRIASYTWVAAGDLGLNSGVVSLSEDEQSGVIRRVLGGINGLGHDDPVKVYNLTVEEDHTYICNGVVVHNCGIALSDRPLWEDVPLWDSKGVPVIQWEGNKIEETAGVVKLDVLGLKTLSLLNFSRRLIKQRHGVDIDWYSLPMDDEKAYKVMWNQRNYGIFQFEEAGMSGFVNACKPKTIHDIAVIVSTYRPGPLGIPGLVERIIGKISGKIGKTDFMFPKYNHIFSNAHNELIFQEGFLLLAKEMCGFSDVKADTLRKAVGKKDLLKLQSLREDFINGAVASGESEIKVSQFWEELMEFARYA